MIKDILGKDSVKVVIKAIAPTLYHRFKRFLNSWLTRIDTKLVSDYEEYMDGAKDHELDPRDIRFSEILEEVEKDGRVATPTKVLLDNGTVQNQGKTNHCVAYGGTETVNETYNAHKSKESFMPVVMVNYIRSKLDKLIDKRGTYIVNAPKAAKALGWIKGYTRVEKAAGILVLKKALALGYGIFTGTNQIIWSKTSQVDKVAVKGAGGGHFINIVGYDDLLTLTDYNKKTYTGFFIVENTWGAKWGTDGRYYIPYAFANDVFFNSRYTAIIPTQREDKKDTLKFDTILDKLLDKKTNGSDNRYFKFLSPYIEKGYKVAFEDYFESDHLTAGEIKTLISLEAIKLAEQSVKMEEPKINKKVKK